MSLPGLLRVIGDDPQLKRALEEADAPLSPGADLIAPPALPGLTIPTSMTGMAGM